MKVDRSALICAMACAYDSWLGTDGNGPERYFYKSVYNYNFDSIRMATFSDYWKVSRGYMRLIENQMKFVKNCFFEVRANELTDSLVEYSDLVTRCTDYGGPKKAEVAASKILFNFFPEFGFVIDSRADKAIRAILKMNKLRPERKCRMGRFEFFYGRESINQLRHEISKHLSQNMLLDLDPNDELLVFSGRFIDKYLFFFGDSKDINFDLETEAFFINTCSHNDIHPSDKAMNFVRDHESRFKELFDTSLASISSDKLARNVMINSCTEKVVAR